AELARLRAANAAEVAEANLRRLVGAPATTRIEPAEPLAEPRGPAAPTESAESPAVEALVQEALARRSERRALQDRIAAGEERERAERANRLPQISLSGGYDYSNPNYRIFPPGARWDDTWDVGVRLSWTAFDSGRRSAAISRAQARTDALRQQRED